MKSLATLIMKSLAKKNQNQWALAMQREFDELATGHLSWAVGCAVVEFRTNFQSNAKLLLAITAVHFLAPIFAGILAAPVFRYSGDGASQLVAFCYAAPWTFLLGFVWPKNVFAITSVGGVIMPLTSGYAISAAILHMSVLDYLSGVGSTMLVELNGIGTIAMVALWFGSATLGARARTQIDAARSYSASNP